MTITRPMRAFVCSVLLGMLTSGAFAHDIDEAGLPVCIEGNYMMADAMNTPFASSFGPGRVIEMNIFTGTPGITVDAPFNPDNIGTPICPYGVVCQGPFANGAAPWKPTGVLSGGQNGHAFITSAAQQALTEFHRDGTPLRSVSYKPITGNPAGPAGFGTVPRPLGTQLMPNGNLIQAICDANFFNASNSDPILPGEPDPGQDGNSSNLYFPPVYSTPERAANSRLLVIDQDTMEVIDEYSQPAKGKPGHDLWGCFAGIMFSDEGLLVSTFHGAAVLVIDWRAGIEKEKSAGVGANRPHDDDDDDDDSHDFEIDKKKNRAKVTRIIDMRPGMAADHPSRRDSLRAISFDESGNVYATDRTRSRDCLRGEYAGSPGGCNPSVFRQRVQIAPLGEDHPTRSVALDPGVNIIAGIRTNRMSGVACNYVRDPANVGHFATDRAPFDQGYTLYEDLCDVETVLVAASAMNPGCDANDDGNPGPGHPANRCFVPGGGVAEYLTHPDFVDGAQGACTGNPNDGYGVGEGNEGCAKPIAMFEYRSPDDGAVETVDPRMLMVIHEAFGQ